MSYSNLVLVVDDSPDTLGMLNLALENAEMATLVALDGRQAIDIAKRMAPDLILLDAIMPQMDGFATCRHLKSDPNLTNIPIIFMTGLSDSENIVKGFEVGGVDYMTKPIDPQELIARIRVHLTNARATLTAQSALDSAGQSIFSVNDRGETIWATPLAAELLSALATGVELESITKDLEVWLSHQPKKGDKRRLNGTDAQFSAVYFGRSSYDQHLIRLLDDNRIDEVALLMETFVVTPREAAVFLWLAKGKTNREIALVLEMSPRTVNKHLEQLFKKLNVDNRTSAAALAIRCLQKKFG